ncbi:efflux RND transporter periplasmic adaptor subunit [Burkholderia latens]|uniref:efflux RND transporter periplasmic adaptor subunit n=1 Tax=Burkholderia latens TaxID=488446 RepID=UPI0015897CB8|nr:efflux RND transporter periplasmic adaptor subunit [Burkholderia latens]
MSTEIQIKSPKRLPNLKLVATIVVLIAVGIVTTGIVGRANAKQEMTRWSAEQAVPTVVAYTPSAAGNGATLVLPGHLSAFESAPIHAQVSGYLHAWYADIGAHVKSGQLLGLIDTPELDQQLQQARADLQSSLANERLAASTAARWTEMLAQDSVSQQETDEKTSDLAAKKAIVAANEANVRRLEALEGFKRIVAPFDGVVTARKTDIGQLISAGGDAGPELFAVSDVHQMRVYVSVPQNETAAIRPGMTATLTVPEHPDESFHATLADTDDSISDSTGTLLVQLIVDNRDGKLIPGEYTEVRFSLPTNSNHALTIQASSLIFRQAGLQVAVVSKDNRAVFKPITIATDFGTRVQVATGLAPTDRVIDNPPDSLSAGDLVRLAAPVGGAASSAPATERANG